MPLPRGLLCIEPGQRLSNIVASSLMLPSTVIGAHACVLAGVVVFGCTVHIAKKTIAARSLVIGILQQASKLIGATLSISSSFCLFFTALTVARLSSRCESLQSVTTTAVDSTEVTNGTRTHFGKLFIQHLLLRVVRAVEVCLY
jgi:hypothetical protein